MHAHQTSLGQSDPLHPTLGGAGGDDCSVSLGGAWRHASGPATAPWLHKEVNYEPIRAALAAYLRLFGYLPLTLLILLLLALIACRTLSELAISLWVDEGLRQVKSHTRILRMTHTPFFPFVTPHSSHLSHPILRMSRTPILPICRTPACRTCRTPFFRTGHTP